MARTSQGPPKVWITRAEPGAKRTAARVEALGFEPLLAPLLSIRFTGASLDLQPFEALALTSGQAVAALGPDIPRKTRLFAVGEATAQAARTAGFTDVTSADGDVQALAELILEAKPLAVVHPAAEKTAGDLVGRLTGVGLPARRVTVYRAEPTRTLPAEVAAAFADEALAAILIHSPRAAQIAGALLAEARIDLAAAPAFGLSPACVRPLARRGFIAHAAAEPKEAALLALLKATI